MITHSMKNLFVFISMAVLRCMGAGAVDRPNILWITSEDHGPQMGCYGDGLARTPNVDALAAKGMLFKHVWSVAPVCAPARTCLITGVYPSSTGGLHMRSMVSLPKEMRMYPQILREAGYYCSNNSKTDYNLREPGKVWDESSGAAHWKKRPEGQPFFAIFNSNKSHESQIRRRPHQQVTDPSRIRVPGYHPDVPAVREDWAQYYDQVSEADADAGTVLKEIEVAGQAGDTVIFYYADHGSGMPRSKRWPCNSGLQVPLVVYFPEKWKHLAPKEYAAGGKSERMISFADLAPTVLSIAGIKPPEWMQGHAFAGPHQSEPQPFLHGERGRMDECMDLVRSTTDGRYVYLRNYFPHVSQAQRVAYQFETPTTRVWHQLFSEGKTNVEQSIFWQVPKEPEELYDLETDRDEVKNLAGSPEHRAVLEKLRAAQREHLVRVKDVCFLPEMEMHSRAVGSTPYEIALDPAKFPLERVLKAADLASNLDPAAVDVLIPLMGDSDSAVRWWATLGLLMRGGEAVTKNVEVLEKALVDASPAVRIAAAQALGRFGDAEALGKALSTLGELAPPDRNGVLVSMSALSAIEALAAKAAPLHAAIASMKPAGASPDRRYDEYVSRLIANIVPGSRAEGEKAKEKGKGRIKKGQ